MIDQTFAAQEHAECAAVEGLAAPGSMKTMLEDRAAAMLHGYERKRLEASRKSWALEDALHKVREARHRGTAPEALDAAIAHLRAVVEGAG